MLREVVAKRHVWDALTTNVKNRSLLQGNPRALKPPIHFPLNSPPLRVRSGRHPTGGNHSRLCRTLRPHRKTSDPIARLMLEVLACM